MMPPSNQYRGGNSGYHPGQPKHQQQPHPQQGYPRQQFHDGIPASVSFNNSSHQQKPGQQYSQPYNNRIHAPQGAPQQMGLQQGPFQQQRNYSSGYIPRQNDITTQQQQYPQQTANVNVPPTHYQNHANSGVPPSAMNRGPQYQGGQSRPY